MSKEDIWKNWIFNAILGIVLFFWATKPGYLLAWIGFCAFKAATAASKVESRSEQDYLLKKKTLEFLETTECKPWIRETGRVKVCRPEAPDEETAKEYLKMEWCRKDNLKHLFVLEEDNLKNLSRFFKAEDLSPEQIARMKTFGIIPDRLTPEEKKVALYINWRDREEFALIELYSPPSDPPGGPITDLENKMCRKPPDLFCRDLCYLNRAFKMVNGYDLYGEKPAGDTPDAQ